MVWVKLFVNLWLVQKFSETRENVEFKKKLKICVPKVLSKLVSSPLIGDADGDGFQNRSN